MDIFAKYLSLSKTTCTFGKLGMHLGREGMIFSKLFGMDNRTNKFDSGSSSFFEFAPV
jgi:hypothetical protein